MTFRHSQRKGKRIGQRFALTRQEVDFGWKVGRHEKQLHAVSGFSTIRIEAAVAFCKVYKKDPNTASAHVSQEGGGLQ